MYLDFAKAFDKVSRHILIDKLKKLEVGGKLLTLLHSYLENRQEYLKIKDDCSDYLDVTSGVPQGSIFGPLLFLIFINDLPNMKPEIENYGFADDFKMIAQSQTESEDGTTHIEMWCKENQMELNASKCKLLNLKSQLSASLKKNNLKEAAVQRDIGLIISSNLNWTENCEIRIQKATGAFFQIKRNISNKSSISTKLHAYAGYVVPILTYCSQAWYASKTNVSKFEIQIKATKWVVNGQVSGYKERLLKLKLLPLGRYAEMHDLLLLILLDGNVYDVEIENMKRKANQILGKMAEVNLK